MPFLMSTRKADSATSLSLTSAAARVRKNGIEFRTVTPIAEWTELTVELRDPEDGSEIQAKGVVVDCQGDRHQGYLVSMVFMDVAPLVQARLNLLAYSNLA